MKNTARIAAFAVCIAFASTGCANENAQPTAAEVDAATARVQATVAGASTTMTAYAAFSIVPFVVLSNDPDAAAARAAEAARGNGRDACLVSWVATEGTSATVHVRFDEAGCEIAGRRIRGETTYRFSYANGCAEAEADMGQLRVDATPIVATAGYRRCDDEQRIWLRTEATVGDERSTDLFSLEGALDLEDGIPIVGSTVLHLDAHGAVDHVRENERDRVTIARLRYAVGEFLPSNGTIHIETADGHDYRATFHEGTWRFGTAEVAIDGMAAVTIPIVH